MSKLDELSKQLNNRETVTPVSIYQTEEQQNISTEEQSSDVRTAEQQNSKLPRKKKSKDTSLDSVVDDYKNDKANDDPQVRRSYFIKESTAKKIEYVNALYFIKRGKHLNMNEVVQLLLDEYFEKLYSEFNRLPANNPFDN